MMKIRIKEEFKGKTIYVGGTEYDFSSMTDEQLAIIWTNNKQFLPFLEEVIVIHTPVEEVLINEEEFRQISKRISKKK